MPRMCAPMIAAVFTVSATCAAIEPGFAPEALSALTLEQRAALVVSRDFLRAASAGNLSSVMTLCSTPFFWNGEQTLQTSDALRKTFATFFAEEGEQNLRTTAEEIYPVGQAIVKTLTSKAQEFVQNSVGKSGILYFAWFQGERLALFLKETDAGTWRVVGFED